MLPQNLKKYESLIWIWDNKTIPLIKLHDFHLLHIKKVLHQKKIWFNQDSKIIEQAVDKIQEYRRDIYERKFLEEKSRFAFKQKLKAADRLLVNLDKIFFDTPDVRHICNIVEDIIKEENGRQNQSNMQKLQRRSTDRIINKS
jgi:hypothetical protein